MDDRRRLAFRQSLHFGVIRLRNSGNRVVDSELFVVNE